MEQELLNAEFEAEKFCKNAEKAKKKASQATQHYLKIKDSFRAMEERIDTTIAVIGNH